MCSATASETVDRPRATDSAGPEFMNHETSAAPPGGDAASFESVAITADNLDVVVDAGRIGKDVLCDDGGDGGPSPCN